MGYTNDRPTVNKAIESVYPVFEDNLTIIDNSINHDIYNSLDFQYCEVIPVLGNLTCAQMFNVMQDVGRQNNVDVLITMHSDFIISDPERFKKIFFDYIEHVIDETDNKWGMILTVHDTIAAYNMDALDIVGEWDTYIDQYPIEADYFRRMELFGFSRHVCPNPDEILVHYPSSTCRKNYLQGWHNARHRVPYNRQYYNLKWNDERWNIPFNGEDIKAWNNYLSD
jgi:hypothetical protein